MYFDNSYREKKIPSQLLSIWRIFYKDKLAMIGLLGVLSLLILVFFGKKLAAYGLDQQFLDYQLLPPVWSKYGSIAYFFGTDDLGRDMLSSLLIGTTYSFGGALIAATAATVCGLTLGISAGMSRSFFSAILNRIPDTILSLPSLLLAIIIVAFVGPSLKNAILAVWLALLPHMVHTVYSAVHNEIDKEYFIAARLDGISTLNILIYTILPNITAVLVTEFTRILSIAILDIAALGFLNLGAQLPAPEWGAMIGKALDLVYVAPWTVMLPGAAILMSVLIVNLFGDGLRRAINASVE